MRTFFTALLMVFARDIHSFAVDEEEVIHQEGMGDLVDFVS